MAGPFHAPAWLGAWVKSRAAVVYYGKAVPTTTHKNSNRLSAAEDRDAHTRKAVFLLKKLES